MRCCGNGRRFVIALFADNRSGDTGHERADQSMALVTQVAMSRRKSLASLGFNLASVRGDQSCKVIFPYVFD